MSWQRIGIVLWLATSAGPMTWAAADLAPGAPAASRPTTAAATQPASTLQAEIVRAVEVAQQKVRQPKLPAPAPKNSLQREEAGADATNPLDAIARELVGKAGL